MRVRFSPSPTGFLHVGNIRTALINYLFSLENKGDFILRLDDTDEKRCKDEYRDAIKEDLSWLGIKWSEVYQQQDNIAKYEQVRDELLAKGKVYACFESDEELGFMRKIQNSRGAPPLYDRSALQLTEEEKQEKIVAGIQPYYRFLLDDEEVRWKDGVRGNISFTKRSFSDPVIFRADGSPTYTFCSVVDDVEHRITDIIRGEDHITNTAVQIQIFKALTENIPNFHHLALIKTKEGEISKRYGGFDVKSLRNSGIDAMAIASLLTRLGSSLNVEPHLDYASLQTNFAMKNFSPSSILYNEKDLILLNRKIIAKRDFADIRKILPVEITEDFWQVVRENIATYNEVTDWNAIFHQEISVTLTAEDKSFLKEASELLPEDLHNFKLWTKSITEKTGRKGKELFHPLRLALTGKESGPELSKIVSLLGREKVEKRLLCQII